jgi:hypothetical protein
MTKITVEYAAKLLSRVAGMEQYTARGVKLWYKHNNPNEDLQGKIWAPGCPVSETINLTKLLSTDISKIPKLMDKARPSPIPGQKSKLTLSALLLREHLKEGGE